MDFNWYTEVSHTEKLTQGDIFFDFPVLIIDYSSDYPFFKPQWTKKDVIVITQACDIEQGKTNEVTFCPIVPVEDIAAKLMALDVKRSRDNVWKSSGKGEDGPIVLDFTKEASTKKARKKIDELRKGEHIPLHLLNETPGQVGRISMGAKVVLLKETYQLPIDSALALAHNEEFYPTRLRLLPPYREHLAQAFSNVYSRIGLPQDIKTSEVKLAFPKSISTRYTPPS